MAGVAVYKPSATEETRIASTGIRTKLRSKIFPKKLPLLLNKIYRSEEAEGEDEDDDGIRFWCEQLIVGNRKTKIVQKKERVPKENNRRILKKRFVSKKKTSNLNSKFSRFYSFLELVSESKSSIYDEKSYVSGTDQVVVSVVQEVESDSDEESSIVVVGAIMEDSDHKEEDEEPTHRRELSGENSTSHIERQN